MSAELSAAAGAVDITPATGHPLGGYAVPHRVGTGTADPLEANLLHLRAPDGNDIVWVSIDALAVHPRLRQLIEQHAAEGFDANPEAVLVAASHTHSGPSDWHGTIHPILPAEVDEAECQRVAQAIGKAARHAAEGRQAARLSWGQGPVVGVGGNRHDRHRPHSSDAGVLTVADDGGALLAVLYDYACHPTVLGPDNTVYSADWVGAARVRVRDALPTVAGGLPVVFLQGSAGDVSARFNRHARNLDEVTRLGNIVGDAVVASVRSGVAIEDSSIRWAQLPINARVRRDFARSESADVVPEPSGDRVEVSRLEGIAAIRALAESSPPAARTSHTTLVRVGQRAWLHHPFELTTRLESSILAPDGRLRVIGYTDEYAGYLADPDSHDRGDYEALASYFDPEETLAIVAQLVEAGSAWAIEMS